MLHGLNANRMTLTRLRKRLVMARRGHTLMKHKLEELMHRFQAEVNQVFQLQDDVHAHLQDVYARFLLGSDRLHAERIASVLCVPVVKTSVDASVENVLNLKMPVLTASVEVEHPPYGMLETSADLDRSVKQLEAALPFLLNLAQGQRRLERLIREIETTRRRVNALEYVLIPQLEQQVQLIQMKLDEIERANVGRLMRIKSIIRKENV